MLTPAASDVKQHTRACQDTTPLRGTTLRAVRFEKGARMIRKQRLGLRIRKTRTTSPFTSPFTSPLHVVQRCAHVWTCRFLCTQKEEAAALLTQPPRAHTPPSRYWRGEPLGFRFESRQVANKGKAGGTGKRGLRLSDGLRLADKPRAPKATVGFIGLLRGKPAQFDKPRTAHARARS
jgi:hypothetical protein